MKSALDDYFTEKIKKKKPQKLEPILCATHRNNQIKYLHALEREDTAHHRVKHDSAGPDVHRWPVFFCFQGARKEEERERVRRRRGNGRREGGEGLEGRRKRKKR